MRVKILDKFWNLEFAKISNKDDNGCCDAPDKPGKKLKVRRSLRGEKVVEIVLHETHHAADWFKDEEWVEDLAAQQAKILCRKEVLERVLDSERLLKQVEHILAKHGYVKE